MATDATSQRVPGHALKYEGTVRRRWYEKEAVIIVDGGWGCGAKPRYMTSHVRISRELMRAWHRAHKAEVLTRVTS
mgnify:CR=1 FL=1